MPKELKSKVEENKVEKKTPTETSKPKAVEVVEDIASPNKPPIVPSEDTPKPEKVPQPEKPEQPEQPKEERNPASLSYGNLDQGVGSEEKSSVTTGEKKTQSLPTVAEEPTDQPLTPAQSKNRDDIERDLFETVSTAGRNIKAYQKATLDSISRMQKLIENENEIRKNYSANLQKNIDMYWEKANNKVERQTFLVKGETYKNIFKLTLAAFSSAGTVRSIKDRFDKEYNLAVSRKDEAFDKYVALSKEYGAAEVGRTQFLLDSQKTLLATYNGAIAADKSLISNQQFMANYKESQENMRITEERLKFDKQKHADNMADKKVKNEIAQQKNNIDAGVKALKHLKENPQGSVLGYNSIKLKNKLNLDIGIPTGKDGTKNTKIIQTLRLGVSTYETFADKTKQLEEITNEINSLGQLGRIKASTIGTAKEYLGYQDKTINLYQRYVDLISTFYNEGKQILGLGRLSDQDLIILKDFLGQFKDGETPSPGEITPTKMISVNRKIKEFRDKLGKNLVKEGNLSIKGRSVTSKEELDSILFFDPVKYQQKRQLASERQASQGNRGYSSSIAEREKQFRKKK